MRKRLRALEFAAKHDAVKRRILAASSLKTGLNEDPNERMGSWRRASRRATLAMMNPPVMAFTDSKQATRRAIVARGLLVLGIWTLFGSWYGTQVFVDMHARGMHHSFAKIALWGILNGWLWIPLMPA